MHRVVVACDLTPPSAAALDAAGAIERRTGAQLWLVHTFDPSLAGDADARQRWHDVAESELSAARDRHGLAGAEVAVLASRAASDALVAFAEEHRADLLVLGASTRHGLERMLGSVAERVVHHARSDVLVVRPVFDPGTFPRSILVGSALSPASAAAEERAAQWARTFAVRLTVAHVYDDSPPLVTTRTAAAHNLDELLIKLRYSNGGSAPTSWRSELLVGLDPGASLCRHAAEHHADLVVVGTHDRTALAHLVLGSVADTVVRRAPVAALVVRG